MFTGKRKLWFIVPALAASVLLIGACSSDDGEDTATPTESAVASETATEAATSTETATETATTEGTTTTEPADSTVVAGESADLGPILTDANGLTLYIFANDETGVSNCVEDTCVQNWPPLTAEGDPTGGDGVDGTLAVIERSDGVMQVTYNGSPLYYYIGDTEAGQTTGEGVGGVWTVAKP
ncbi:MAG: hypothetical protein R3C39_14410 [Dehalococcoidia bacterium]